MKDRNSPARSWLERTRMWFANPEGASELWLGKPCVFVAWVGLLLAIGSPPHGTGVSVCWLQSATGIPCLGCGLTRSLSCGIRGMLGQSWVYHPMGLMILGLFAFIAAQSLLPARCRALLKAHIQTSSTLFKAIYVGFVTVFVAYGSIRALVHLLHSTVT